VYTLNYQHLRYFWAVSFHSNLTRASVELHLTPQTVSTQIRDLENGLGVELFSREGCRLVLTDRSLRIRLWSKIVMYISNHGFERSGLDFAVSNILIIKFSIFFKSFCNRRDSL